MKFSEPVFVGVFVLLGLASIAAAAVVSASEQAGGMVNGMQAHVAPPAEADLGQRLLPHQEEPSPAQGEGSVQLPAAPSARSTGLEPQFAPETAEVQRAYRSADSGDPKAMMHLGVFFQQGVGVPQSYPEALKWYLRAANLGEAEAMNNIGTLYLAGQGVPQDYAEAIRWYQHAIESGSLMAMSNMAKLYYFGLGVARSYPEAAKWFELASVRGSASAMNSLGLMYESGIGVRQDRDAAVTLLKHAARLGYGPAMANLGSLYENGDGVENNPIEAYAWIDAALKAGIPAEARDTIIYRLGAISVRLSQRDLAVALQRADEISSSVHVAEQPLPASAGAPTLSH
jgi:TPR repeat protein